MCERNHNDKSGVCRIREEKAAMQAHVACLSKMHSACCAHDSEMVNMNKATARFIAGTVSPIGADRHPMPQPEPLLPEDIVQISRSIEIADYTNEGVREAIDKRYWLCVDELVKEGAQRITLAGFPIASQLTRPRVLALTEETSKRTGVTADSHAEATVAAMQHLRAQRIAIASRWSAQLNNALLDYLTQAGFEVLTVTSAGQWAKQAFSMSIEEGIKLAFQLGRQAMREAPQAQALLLAGGAWRSLAAVPVLEDDYKIPVVTNPIAQVWRLIAAGIAPQVKGWGRLLAGS
jgi:maleate cis-trans isomerase